MCFSDFYCSKTEVINLKKNKIKILCATFAIGTIFMIPFVKSNVCSIEQQNNQQHVYQIGNSSSVITK